MAYTKVGWQDLPSTSTPRNATNLGHMDDGIENNDKRLNGTSPMGDVIVDSIQSKNMFNEAQLLIASGWSKNSSGYYYGTIDYYYTSFRNGFTIANNFETNTQYTLSLTGYVSGGNADFIFEYTDNTTSSVRISATSSTNYTLTSTANKTISKVKASYGTGSSQTLYLKNVQLEKGTSATTYTEFQGIGYVSGQNSNGSYVKYDDGRMEVWGSKTLGTVAITTQNGNLYNSASQTAIDFPVSFIERPVYCSITGRGGDGMYLIIQPSLPATSNTGNYYLARGNSTTLNNIGVGYYAIGRWK